MVQHKAFEAVREQRDLIHPARGEVELQCAECIIVGNKVGFISELSLLWPEDPGPAIFLALRRNDGAISYLEKGCGAFTNDRRKQRTRIISGRAFGLPRGISDLVRYT